jgi:general secretion pathway protein L
MTSLGRTGEILSRWLDVVAGAIAAVIERFRFPHAVEIVEDEDGTFVIRPAKGAPTVARTERVVIADGRIVGPVPGKVATMLHGSRAELVLRPTRFLFPALELPRRAAEFLDGVVRAQIDRLTPWSAADVVFGCSKPHDLGPDRIAVTVAATARSQVTPFVQALSGFRAASISVSTLAPDSGGGSTLVTVLQERAQAALNFVRIRRALAAVLVAAALAAALAGGAATVVGATLAARQDDLARRINERRAAIRAGNDNGAPPTTAIERLAQRKHDSPSSVVVLEVLSQILPDHTYVLELRIEGDKLRVTGITRDAPALIRLIEQSSHFTRATFFAPTTRQPNDPGERFHIEARIEPVFLPRS